MCLWLNFIITDDVFLYPICLAGRVCARPDQSPFVCSMSAGPGLGSLLHTTTQYNLSKRDYASAVWLKHQQGGLDGRTQTVNKAARLGHTAPNAPSLTSLSRTWSMMFTRGFQFVLFVFKPWSHIVFTLLKRPFSTDTELTSLRQTWQTRFLKSNYFI